MTSRVLVLHPANANLGPTSASLHLDRQNQVLELLQAPLLEAVESQQLGIAIRDEHAPSLASGFLLALAHTSHLKTRVIHRGYAEPLLDDSVAGLPTDKISIETCLKI